ncbi:unnamed protein product [Caenorhabditis sp. 36 PRJEB53466]|nr:unnamed protein product [Caenorhabditis sp. 36 PRJEB53466]
MPYTSKRNLQRSSAAQEAGAVHTASAEARRITENLQSRIDELERQNISLQKAVEEGNKARGKLEQHIARLENDLQREKEKHENTTNSLKELRDQLTEEVKKKVDSRVERGLHYSTERIAKLEEQLRKEMDKETFPESLKTYSSLIKKETKVDRFIRLVKTIERHVQAENLNQFLYDFINWISENRNFNFNLRLSPFQSFYATVRFKLTDSFLRDFKNFLTKGLNFDIFASRQSIYAIRRSLSVVDEYVIVVEQSSKSVNGRRMEYPTPWVRIRSVETSLARRLETAASHGNLVFDEGTADDIVLGVGGDKGGEFTKLCLVFENVRHPNDPRGILLLGLYAGPDDYEHLKAKFSDIFEQINSLESIKYSVNGVEVEKIVRKKALGDCKFLSSLFHHQGQSAAAPCFTCEAHWPRSGQHKATTTSFAFEESGEIRQLQDFNEPLLHLDPKQAGVPAVHGIQGVFQTYVIDWMYSSCHQVDYPFDELPTDLKSQKKRLTELSDIEQTAEDRVDGLQSVLDVVVAVESALEKIQKNGPGRRRSDKTCSSQTCFINVIDRKFKEQESFVCGSCKKEYHLVCCGFFSAVDCIVITPNTKCQSCRFPGNFTVDNKKSHVGKVRRSLEDMIGEEKSMLENAQIERITLQQMFEESSGETLRAMERLMRTMGADTRAWYQQCTGNQVRALLREENIDKLLELFPSNPKVPAMRKLMLDLSFLMSSANNEVKDDTQIDEIGKAIRSLVINIREVHPEAGVIPKLHIIAAHLEAYLRENRSWGRLTEQGIEALHAIFNGLMRRFASVNDVKQRICLVLENMGHFNFLFDVGDLC